MPAYLVIPFVSLGLVVCWSSGYIGTQMAADAGGDPFALFGWRFLFAALLCLALVAIVGRRPVWSPRAIGHELVAGSLNVGVYLLAVVWAIQLGVSPAVTALVTALQPLMATLAMSLLRGERIAPLGWAGSVLAAAGVVVCAAGEMRDVGGAPAWAYLLPVVSAVTLTVGSLWSERAPRTLGSVERLLWQLAAAAVVFAVAVLVRTGELPAWPARDVQAWQAIVFLVVLSSLGGYGFFNASLRLRGVTYTSLMFYLTPPTTALWAALQFGDRVGPSGWAGAVLVAAGVVLALRALNRKSTIPPRCRRPASA
ncbi:hypothetical protein SADO_03875 [Salinisphaera dokdonensis CL-ES53]|uniref:EamA domain-containing protein n=1 Tax=Salinisphaera dokdonensis CL-ES53 TaxID=1304272 RepID=A0ABV2AXI8_9GAMM